MLVGSPSIERTWSDDMPISSAGVFTVLPSGTAGVSLAWTEASGGDGDQATPFQISTATTSTTAKATMPERRDVRRLDGKGWRADDALASGTEKRTRKVAPGRRPC